MIAFAHLSDTHFGPALANQGAGPVPGQQPHHAVKCLALPAALDAAWDAMQLPDDAAALPVVVSGDLTVSGATEELAVAQAYLGGRFPIARLPGPAFEMGLGTSPRRPVLTIPGNHDHWDGQRITMGAYNSALYPGDFDPTPWRQTLASADGALTLELVGVDSNSGWQPGPGRPLLAGMQARMAQGMLTPSQIATVRAWYRQRQQRPAAAAPTAEQPSLVRALLCHHSLAYQGGISGRLAMDANSRQILLHLCAEFRVSALLTGHTHDAHHHRHNTPDPQGQWVACEELRCAHSVGFGKRKPTQPAEEVGFLTHRLQRLPEGRVRWDTWRWVWKTRGYEPDPIGPWHSFVAHTV